jgi:hypothetical protein
MNAEQKIKAQQEQIDTLTITNSKLYCGLIQVTAERDIAIDKVNEASAVMEEMRTAIESRMTNGKH